MDIAATKLELMRLLLQTENEAVLAKLKVVLEEGIRQADRGELVNEKDMDLFLEKWK